MRVSALTLDYLPARRIGSEVATHEVLKRLVERGHRVTVVPKFAAGRARWMVDGVRVDPDADVEAADLIWTHAELLRAVHERAPDVPVAAATHNVTPRTVLGLAWPVDLLVHNAHATAAALERYAPDVTSTVMHPVVRVEDYQADGPHDHVTLIGCSPAKGIAVLSAFARARPDDRYLAVAGGYGQQRRIRRPCITHLPHTEDMREVYARTRVLIVPSRHESYGRVVVEAMCSGIPVIASDLPGLREAGEDAALYVPLHDRPAWLAALESLDDPVMYAAAREASLARVARLDPGGDLDRVAVLLERLAVGPWAAAAG